MAGLALLLVGVIALAGGGRRLVLRGVALTAGFALVLAPGVVYDLVERQRSFGGTQGYEAYLSAKVSLGPVAGDLSVVFSVLAVGALALALRAVRGERELLAPLCLLAVVVALAYGWLLHLPLPYFRMAYFLPVALVPLVAIAFGRLPGARRAAPAGALACAAIAAFAWVHLERARLLRLRQRRLVARARRGGGGPRAARGGGHRPLLELPERLAAAHADARRARAGGHRATRRAAASARRARCA